jgi:hypothetical protein
VRLYHGTTEEAAAAILADGFRDSEPELFQLELEMFGVWLSDHQLHWSGAMLAVDVDDDVAAQHELIEDPPPRSRIWTVPATTLNRYPVTVVDDDPMG